VHKEAKRIAFIFAIQNPLIHATMGKNECDENK
jgi:hypothetical protein